MVKTIKECLMSETLINGHHDIVLRCFNMPFVRADLKAERKTVISDKEFEDMIQKADQLPTEYFRFRAKAILCTLKGQVSEDRKWLG